MLANREDATNAFTLVELLVVIGIIALLISLLLPALGRARKAAEQSVCLSNLHQLAICDLTYAADNKGLLCGADVAGYIAGQTVNIDGVTGPPGTQWNYLFTYGPGGIYYYDYKRGFLGKYLQSPKALQCPGLKLEVTTFDPKHVDFPMTEYALTNIATWGPSAKQGRSLSTVRSPTTTAMFADVIAFNSGSVQYSLPGFSWPAALGQPSGQTSGSYFHGRHLGNRGGVSFYDGHAEMLAPALRANGTYNSNVDPGTYQAYLGLHIGELTPATFTVSGMLPDTTANAYTTNAQSKYDFYFWPNKDKPGL